MQPDAVPPAASQPGSQESRPSSEEAWPHTAGAPMETPLRLALVTTELSVGGAERCLANLAMGLHGAGDFRPVVYSLAPPPPPERAALVRQLDDAGIPVQFLDVTSPRQVLSAIKRLRGALRMQQPHIVQTLLFHANVVGSLAAGLAGDAPIVTGIRVADPRRRRHLVERLVVRLLAGRVRRIVCVSEDVAEFCRRTARLPADKLTVIPNGIDPARYADVSPADPGELGVPPGAKLLLCVGRLDRQKGLDWLLPLLPELLSDHPGLHLLIAGDGPERAALARQAQSLGIASRVHFAGWRPDVPRLLASAAILLLPSRWEGMPNVVLEAMAAGLPVLAAGVSGVAELLGEGAAQQMYEPENTRDFLGKLAVLLDQPDRAAQWGKTNQKRIRQHFSLAAMCDAYRQLYRSLIAR